MLRAGGRALAERGAGTLVQVAGGSTRRGMPGRGPWGAASAAARALTQSAAAELRPAGVHVALLILDGIVATDRNPMTGRPPEASIHPDDAAAAVAYLAGQSAPGLDPRAHGHPGARDLGPVSRRPRCTPGTRAGTAPR